MFKLLQATGPAVVLSRQYSYKEVTDKLLAFLLIDMQGRYVELES